MKKIEQYTGILTLLFLLNLSLSAQTSEELNKKYGEPVDGVYKINEKVSFSVKYGEDKKVCLATISKHYSLERPFFNLNNAKQRVENNENEDYYEFMKTFFPFSMYGKVIKNNGSSVGNCYTRTFIEYENILVSGHVEACKGEANYVSTSLMWKRDTCLKLKKTEN